MKRWLSLVILVSLINGCNSNIQEGVKNGESNQEIVLRGEKSMNQIDYKIIKTSATPRDQEEYMHGSEENLVFHSDNATRVKDFNKEYEKLTGEKAPKFDGVMLISKMGTKSTGGYSMDIESVIDSGDRYIEVILIKNAPNGNLVTMGFTNPFIVVNIPNTHKNLNIIAK